LPVKSLDEATSIYFSTEQIMEDEYRNKHIECLGDLIEILENIKEAMLIWFSMLFTTSVVY